MNRQQFKNLIHKYHQLNEYELEQISRNPNNELHEQILNLEIQDVRLDILYNELSKYFKSKGYKSISFMAEPNCFAIVMKDGLKTIAYPVFDYSAISNKKVKQKKDFHKATIDFVKLISNYGLTGTSFFLRRFPDCEDVMIDALKITNQENYKKALSGLIEEQGSLTKMMCQPQPESLIQKMIKREKYLAQKITNIKNTISEDKDEIELSIN